MRIEGASSAPLGSVDGRSHGWSSDRPRIVLRVHRCVVPFLVARRAVLLGLLAFVVLAVAAHVAYPGGSWFDPDAPRVSFWTNYWSDLLRPIALDGTPNPIGARLALAGIVVLATTLLVFWWSVPAAAHESRRRRLVAGLFGTASAMLLAPLALRVGPKLTMLVTASVLGLVALGSVLSGTWRATPTRLHVLGVLLIAIIVGVVALHIEDVLLGANARPVTPALQKLGTVLLVAWMFELTRWCRSPVR